MNIDKNNKNNEDGNFTAEKLTGFKRVMPAFKYSLSGLTAALTEPAIKLELQMMAWNFILILIIYVFKYQYVSNLHQAIPYIFWALSVLCIWLLILIIEIINTAIETAIDYISAKKHPLAKKAKDLGSAAVFLALFICVVLNISILVFILK